MHFIWENSERLTFMKRDVTLSLSRLQSPYLTFSQML
jgi:hypothetical protein